MDNCKKVPGKFVLLNNVSLHILILFIILSSLFVFYISKIESQTINAEILKNINEIDLKSYSSFKPFITNYINNNYIPELNKAADNYMSNTYIPNLNKTAKDFVNNINSSCSPTDSFPCNKDGSDPLSPEERLFINNKLLFNTKETINKGIDKYQPNLTEYVKNKFDNNLAPWMKDYLKSKNIESEVFKPEYFDFIINQLSQSKDYLAEEINRKVIEEICIVIGFLILIALIINIVPTKLFKYCNNTLLGIIGELVLVFFLIGIIEVWFFKNVATKFVPTKPSLILQTFKDKILNILK